MFENIGKKIVNAGKGVVRGTQTFSETVSLNARIDECRKNLNNCYSQLGQAYYTRAQGNIPPEFKGIFDQIQMLNQNIIQLQEQIKIVKGIRQCPNCGAEVPNNVMFCGNCGYSMPPVQSRGSANGPVCSNCGAPLEAGAAFCTNCGAKAAQPEQPDLGGGFPETSPQPAPGAYMQPEPYSQPEVQNTVFAKTEPEPIPQPEPAGRVCPNCGTPAAEDAAFCNECGASLLTEEKPRESYSYGGPGSAPSDEDARQPEFSPSGAGMMEAPSDLDQPSGFEYQNFQQSSDMKENTPAGKVCPSCGTRLEEDAVFCSECGTRVG